MRVRKLLFACLCAVFAWGCNGGDDDDEDDEERDSIAEQCESLCEDSKDCDGAEPVDCEAACEDAEQLVEASGCTEEYSDLMDCYWNEVEDICDVLPESCEAEAELYLSCFDAS